MRMIRTVPVVAAAAALMLTACGGANSTAGGPVALTWWHNGTNGPIVQVWEGAAADYRAAHPDVAIDVQPIQNEDFGTKIPLALQSTTPPDVYQQWGGGDLASQVTSGKVADITDATRGWIGYAGDFAEGWQVDGRQFGVPLLQHVVGFWYREDLFAQAGITTTPTTLAEFNDVVAKLKRAGIVPIAVGGKDRWPDAFYWNYFAVRECSKEVIEHSVESLELEDQCWRRAGEDLKAFLATEPFQPGFNGTPAQQGAGSSAGLVANGKAAMELQGDWQSGTMSGLTEDEDLEAKLGWFPFPTVPGGQGDPAAVLGGGDGFSCTTRAAQACADFLRHLAGDEVQTELASSGAGLPVNPNAAGALRTEALKTVFEHGREAPYVQMYFDRALPTNVGAALNEAVANFFAGQGTPEGIVEAVNKAASGNR